MAHLPGHRPPLEHRAADAPLRREDVVGTMTTPGEPETEAGRDLLGWRGHHTWWTEQRWIVAILAIEAEARAEASAEMERLRAHRHIPEWPSTCTGCEHLAADRETGSCHCACYPCRASAHEVEREP